MKRAHIVVNDHDLNNKMFGGVRTTAENRTRRRSTMHMLATNISSDREQVYVRRCMYVLC